MSNAFIFPGQGSQAIGMGKELYDKYPVSKQVFEEVDDALGYKLSQIIFDGPLAVLTKTENTQPALMATSIAFVRTIESELGKKIYDLCSLMAGHSLGEYTALCAAGSITLKDAAQILKIRGNAMQNACKGKETAMAACLRISYHDLSEVISYCRDEGIVEIANDNSESQIIISGERRAVDRVVSIIKDIGKKAIKLNVSAPFHSSLISNASEVMSQALAKINILSPQVPVIQNISGKLETDPLIIRENLVKQVTGLVRWRETIERFASHNINNITEIGSGKVLTGLLKRSKHHFNLFNIGSLDELRSFINSC